MKTASRSIRGKEGVFCRGELVSFSQAKEYNACILQRRNSFGKDEGSVNRRGTEPSVFVSGAFASLIYARIARQGRLGFELRLSSLDLEMKTQTRKTQFVPGGLLR